MSGQRISSVNVGTARDLSWRGRIYRTAFLKDPVSSRVAVGLEGAEGDEQADRTVHGGRDKAIYAYPSEHYPYWEAELGHAYGPGGFGENLTTAGVTEAGLRIGDRLAVGSVVFTVTQPRIPCVKMAARFGRPDMLKRFVRAARPGFYLRVDSPGDVGAGDPIVLVEPNDGAPTLVHVFRLLTGLEKDREDIAAALACPDLGSGARGDLERSLGAPGPAAP